MTRRLFLQRGHASSAGRSCQGQGGADLDFDNLDPSRAQEVQNNIREAREAFDQILNASSDGILEEVGIRE